MKIDLSTFWWAREYAGQVLSGAESCNTPLSPFHFSKP